jgi:hypothetical protein
LVNINSRIRHIKCDEGKPSCKRCLDTGRKCDGYASSETSSPGRPNGQPSALQPLSVFQFADPREHRAFDYFIACTAPELCGYFSPAIWLEHVPKLSFTQSALRHAIVAIAALHEGYAGGVQKSARDTQLAAYSFALKQYSISVRDLKEAISLNPDNLEPILLCCALFVCFDSLRGNYSSAATHLEAGLKLLSNGRVYRPSRPGRAGKSLREATPVQKGIVGVFTALGLQAGIFMDSVLPVDTTNIWQHIERVNDDYDPGIFHTIDEARHSINIILCNFMLHHTTYQARISNTDPDAPGITTQGFEESLPTSNVVEELATWSRAFDSMIIHRNPANLSSNALRGSILLKLHHASLTAIAKSALMTEVEPDDPDLNAPFETIITLTRSLIAATTSSPRSKASISSDLGLIGPLFITISRCKVPHLRLEALAFLKSIPRREGMWDAEIIARIAMGVLETEEKNAADETELQEKLSLEFTAVRITSNEDITGDLTKKLVIDLDYHRTDSQGRRMVATERLFGKKDIGD